MGINWFTSLFHHAHFFQYYNYEEKLWNLLFNIFYFESFSKLNRGNGWLGNRGIMYIHTQHLPSNRGRHNKNFFYIFSYFSVQKLYSQLPGNSRKGSEDVVSAVCYTIWTIYLSLCTLTAETTSAEPFSWIPLYLNTYYT